jgi:hypothetical protein
VMDDARNRVREVDLPDAGGMPQWVD